MTTLNQIGDQLFQSLTVPPDGVRQMIVAESRAGVDGYALWRTGFRGEPFAVVSVVDLGSLALGELKYYVYESLVGAIVGVVWASIPVTKCLFLIQNVRMISLKNVLTGVGGLSGGDTLLRAEWTLLPIVPGTPEST